MKLTSHLHLVWKLRTNVLLHTRQSSSQNNKYQVSHKHSCFPWWWAHIRPKHVEIDTYTKNKYTKNKLCTKLALFTRWTTGALRVCLHEVRRVHWMLMLRSVAYCKTTFLRIYFPAFLGCNFPSWMSYFPAFFFAQPVKFILPEQLYCASCWEI